MKAMVLISALLVSSAALAQEAAPAPSGSDKLTKMTFNQVSAVYAALGALDGFQKIVTEGGKDRAILQAYDLSEATREAIADDEIALQDITMKVQAEAKALGKSLGDAANKDGSPEHKQWLDYANGLGDKEFRAVVTKLNRTELNLRTNAIPPSVLAALDPVIDKNKK